MLDEGASDSGASQHMCGDKEWFISFHKFAKPKAVYLTDKKVVEAEGQGRVQIMAYAREMDTVNHRRRLIY